MLVAFHPQTNLYRRMKHLPILLASIVARLGALHVYWAARGVSQKSIALPQADGKPLFLPGRRITLLVGVALFSAAYVALSRGGILNAASAGSLTHWVAVACGVVFVARAIGEFRYVGFFKTVTGSRFASWDTQVFSPLSLFMGLAYLAIAFG